MNPFERYDIDPLDGPDAITERLRELIADADEDEREQLRAIWEELTMHANGRLALALAAYPETRDEVGGPPPPPSTVLPPLSPAIGFSDVVLVPSVAGVLSPWPEEERFTPAPIEHDPILQTEEP